MGTYILRRVIQAIVILFGLSIVFFIILHLTPGGPCAGSEFGQGFAAVAREKACIQRLGINQPLYVQYVKQMGPYLHGDFGFSNSGDNIGSVILEKLPPTILLLGVSYLVQQLIALPLGIFAALRQYSLFDQVFTFLSYVGFSLPTFWFGLILIFTFAVQIRWFPIGQVQSVNLPIFWTSGWFHALAHHPGLVLGDLALHLTLPALTLMVIGIAGDSRFMRASMLDVLHQDYIRTAKAKGLSPARVVFKHAFRNAVLPIVTNIALFLPALVGGAVITETIFSWGGLGFLFIQSIQASDYPTLQALLMIGALAVLIANLLADITYALVDPRIRYD